MSHRIAVVILNWNTRNFLEKFLPDVIKFSGDSAQVFVVDNGSTDDSVNFVETHFHTVSVIRNEKNEGFTGGYNSSLFKIDAEYFLILNSDVQVTENYLEPLIRLMDSNPKIGACQPKILSFHEPEQFEYAGAAGGFIDKYGYPFCRGRIFNSIEKDENQYNNSIPIFWASGACMFVRSKLFNELGGFDDKFFAHMEEIDLCWRMKHAGYSIYFVPTAKVFHVGGGTLAKSNPRKTYLNFRNNLLMLYKNSPEKTLNSVLYMRMILDFLASVKFLLNGSFKDFKAVWNARKDFKTLKSSYSRPFSKDGVNKSLSGKLIYPKSILWDYYLCGRRTFTSLDWKIKEEN